MIAVIMGMLGIALALNGLLLIPSVESALHQQLVALYLVGGPLVFGLAVLVARASSMVEHLSVLAKRTAGEEQESIRPATVSEAKVSLRINSATHMKICPSCSRENPPNNERCACGARLDR